MPDGYKPDYRIDNMGYWKKMAKAGLVDVQPNVPAPPSQYTGSELKSNSIKSIRSVDVPVTDENSTQSENSIFVNPDDIDNVLNSNNSTTNPASTLYGANGLFTIDGGSTWGGQIQGTRRVYPGSMKTIRRLQAGNSKILVDVAQATSGHP